MRLLLCVVALVLMSNVNADEMKIDGFRCGNKFVKYNMTQDEVLKICPKTQHPKRQSVNGVAYYRPSKSNNTQQHYYEYKWYFERYGKFRNYIHFNRGRVSLITVDNSIRD